MELCSGNTLTEGIDIRCVVVERDERSIADEDVSEGFETAAELVATGIEILDGVIEDLSQEGNESGREPPVERGIAELGELSHFDVAFEERLDGAFRASTEAEREGVEQRNDVELALSLEEIRNAPVCVF
jgi:hypothetical protein